MEAGEDTTPGLALVGEWNVGFHLGHLPGLKDSVRFVYLTLQPDVVHVLRAPFSALHLRGLEGGQGVVRPRSVVPVVVVVRVLVVPLCGQSRDSTVNIEFSGSVGRTTHLTKPRRELGWKSMGGWLGGCLTGKRPYCGQSNRNPAGIKFF